MGEAMRALARPGRRRRRRGGGARACGRSRVGASGSSGSAAPGSPRYARRRARRGGRRSPAGTGTRRRTSRRPRSRDPRRRLPRSRRRARAAAKPSSRRRTPGGSPGRSRAEFLAELAALAPVDRRRGRARQDDDGGDDRVRASTGSGSTRRSRSAARSRSSAATRGRGPAGSSSRETSPTARVASLPAEIAVITNVDLDHHTTFASRAEVEALFDGWLAGAARRAGRARRGARAARARARRPRRAQPAQRGLRARARSSSPASREEAAERARRVPRRRPAARAARRGGRRPRRRRLRPPSRRGRGVARGGARARRRGARARPLPATPLLAHAPPRARAGRGARGTPTPRASPTSTPRARSRSTGVTGKLVVDAALRAPAGHAGRLGAGARGGGRARRVAGRAPGDLVLTIGAGDVDAAVPAARDDSRGEALEENVALSRFTTLGTGGPARWFAKPGDGGRAASSCCAGRAERDIPVAPVGLGLEPARRGRGLPGARAQARRRRSPTSDGDATAGSSPGGGAPLAVCLHRARAAGLGGIEFACAIPGTVGGAVWMNAGAYGERHRRRCSRARSSSTRRGRAWLTPEELGLRTAARTSSAARSSPGGAPARAAARSRRSRRPSPRCRRSGRPRSRRTSGRSAASSRTPTTSSPPGGCSRRAACAASRIGGARISPKHANFIENAGGARSADAVALIAEARRRALEQFGVALEPEVQLLGPIEIPPLGRRTVARRGEGAARGTASEPCSGARTLGAAVARTSPRLRPARRSALAARLRRRRPRGVSVSPTWPRARPRSSPSATVEVAGCRARVAADVRDALAPARGNEPRRPRSGAARAAARGAPDRSLGPRRPRVPARASRSTSSPERPLAVFRDGARALARRRERAGDRADGADGGARLPRIRVDGSRTPTVGGTLPSDDAEAR